MKVKMLFLIGVLCITLIGTVATKVYADPENASIKWDFAPNRDWSVTVSDPDGIQMVNVICYKSPVEAIVQESFQCPNCPKEFTFVIPRAHWNDHDHSIRILDCQTTPHSILWIWRRGETSPDGPYYSLVGGYSVPVDKKPDSSTPYIIFTAAVIPLTFGALYTWNRRGRKVFVKRYQA